MQITADDPDLVSAVRANVSAALAEDIGEGDITAALIGSDELAEARVITRDAGVFCGTPWVEETCRQVDPNIDVKMLVKDGDRLEADQPLFELRGAARSLLTAERTLLNFVQLLSGTATRTSRYAALIAHTSARLLDTRKTVPGLRLAQKYAVRCGGGHNHRIGLFDQFLIKENHIAAKGSIRAAVTAAKQFGPESKRVEVEVESLEELDEAISAGADIALIDNFSLEETTAAVARASGRIELEASGGITEQSITDIAETGVDYISTGDVTKQVTPLDLSMLFSQRTQS
jgi:nicotinate-nucleotide pyrophosphorylase (carboxylating)